MLLGIVKKKTLLKTFTEQKFIFSIQFGSIFCYIRFCPDSTNQVFIKKFQIEFITKNRKIPLRK